MNYFDIKNKDLPIVLKILHFLVIITSLFLVVVVSLEMFQFIPGFPEKINLRLQLGICMVFLADFFVGLFLSKKKWHYFKTRFIFLLIAIPYLNIVAFSGANVDPHIYYFLKMIPLIRGGYALFVITSWLTNNKATSLFFTYLIMMLAMIYFCTLLFYTLEKDVNPNVKTIGDAMWWAFMDMTTVGSNIYAMTTGGKIMSVLLASFGMMMFPIFTVYITDRVVKTKADPEKDKPQTDEQKDIEQ